MAEQRRYHYLGYKYTNTSVKLNEHFDWLMPRMVGCRLWFIHPQVSFSIGQG